MKKIGVSLFPRSNSVSKFVRRSTPRSKFIRSVSRREPAASCEAHFAGGRAHEEGVGWSSVWEVKHSGGEPAGCGHQKPNKQIKKKRKKKGRLPQNESPRDEPKRTAKRLASAARDGDAAERDASERNAEWEGNVYEAGRRRATKGGSGASPRSTRQ